MSDHPPAHIEIPALVEPHAHLDKAFLAERVPNPTGDLMGAIYAIEAARDSITVADTIERAERAARLMLANGVTAIRTHADTTVFNGLTSVHALIEVRERLRELMTIQVCALTGWPVLGNEGAEHRALLHAAIDAGVDLIGGCPHLEDDPNAANDFFLGVAAEHDLPLDLHTDETLDPRATALADLADKVISTGHCGMVTASHCVSLSVADETTQRRVAERLAQAGIGVIALPQTNLFLQGRDHQQSMPRAVAPVRALRAAGVVVAAGADNLQDPFNPVGRGDPLETASLMIVATHVLPNDALAMVSTLARQVIGLPPSADRVRVPASSVREAIAFGPSGRQLLRSG